MLNKVIIILIFLASCNNDIKQQDYSKEERYKDSAVNIFKMITDKQYDNIFKLFFAKPGNKQLIVELIDEVATMLETYGFPDKKDLVIQRRVTDAIFIDVTYNLPEKQSITLFFEDKIGPNKILDIYVDKPINYEELYKIFPELQYPPAD